MGLDEQLSELPFVLSTRSGAILHWCHNCADTFTGLLFGFGPATVVMATSKTRECELCDLEQCPIDGIHRDIDLALRTRLHEQYM